MRRRNLGTRWEIPVDSGFVAFGIDEFEEETLKTIVECGGHSLKDSEEVSDELPPVTREWFMILGIPPGMELLSQGFLAAGNVFLLPLVLEEPAVSSEEGLLRDLDWLITRLVEFFASLIRRPQPSHGDSKRWVLGLALAISSHHLVSKTD